MIDTATARKWINANSANLGVATIFVSFVVIALVAWNTPQGDDTPDRPHVGTCTTATGKGESPCWHYDSQSGWILNLDNGRTFYVATTEDVITR